MKTKILLSILILVVFTACNKPQAKETPLSAIMSEIKTQINLENPKEEDLTIQKNAEKYGISPQSITEGIAYYTTSDNKSDKIIIVRTKSIDDTDKVEEALSAEKVSAISSWVDNKIESQKIEKSILKTKDDCIILAISDKTKEIEEIFDKNL